MSTFYRYILKPVLFLFEPEFIHDVFIFLGEMLGKFWITRKVVGLVYGFNLNASSRSVSNSGRTCDISKIVDGIKYRTPILLAAGFDYNGRLTNILSHVGFGGEEVGSVTAHPCEGNPKPRMTRLPKSQSIIVNKGLRNEGVDAIIMRLKNAGVGRKNGALTTVGDTEVVSKFVVGVSIARTNSPKTAPLESAVDDYAYSLKRLIEEGIGDYYTINISCPNAFGGEAFTKPELLTNLLAKLVTIPCTKPIYVKMPINLPWDEFNKLLKIIDFYKLQGVIIGNLNKDYESIGQHCEVPDEYAGGLSGAPCNKLSSELIRKTRQAYGKRFTIIGVGGIFSAADAREKFDAGADLVQLITGMIYEGPGLIREICNDLAKK